MPSAEMLKSAIASEAIAALSAMSPPVALLSSTTFLAAPSRISVMLIPDCASCMMASDASVALTLSIGSMPSSWIKSLSGATSSVASPITAAMSATPCSRLAALPTPSAITAVVPASAAPIAVTAPTTPTETVFCKLPNAASMPVVLRLSLSSESPTSFSADDALSLALISMSSVAIVPRKKRR